MAVVVGLALLPSCSFVKGRQCGDVGPVTGRDAIDVESYQQANMALFKTLPRPNGAEMSKVDHRSYSRCPDGGGGDIVGVTSIVSVRLDPPVSKCEVAAIVEGGLRNEGWKVSSGETAAEGGGSSRGAHAYRGKARVAFSIEPDPSEYALFVDHDSPFNDGAFEADFDSPCG
ncbi:MAG: hypothetical protein V7636_2706 [Actinomycetota bacterium]